MKDYEIVGWPEIQELMDEEGFEENATLITPNDNMGIGSSTYLISKEWFEVSDKLNIDTLVKSYKQRLLSRANGMENNPLIDMCLTPIYMELTILLTL